MDTRVKLYRGEVFHFTASPLETADAYTYHEDGALVVSPQGTVLETGPYVTVRAHYSQAVETDYSGRLIMPGFIDSHIHCPQSEIIGMYGKQLLDWLNEYTYPAETVFSSEEYAERVARFFVGELLRNGTTTCMAYATVYPVSVSALFAVASEYNMRILTGKILMDRNLPEELRDTVETGYAGSRELIERWHGTGRNHYVITPRFAITSSPEQLRMAAALHREYPGTYIQTHLSENRDEVISALDIHKGYSDYLEIYERAGLLTDRTVFGHCIYLSEDECRRMAHAHAVIAHCPTSNLFLGSGLFPMEQANRFGIRTTIATDVAGGTSFSMFRTLGEAYKVQQLNGYPISTLELFYKSTLGTARALKLDDKIGNFSPGKEADFIVVDYTSTPTQKARTDYLERNGKESILNKLFGLLTLGDDRAIVATYLMGKHIL